MAVGSVFMLVPIGQIKIAEATLRIPLMAAVLISILFLVVVSLFRRDEIRMLWASVSRILKRRNAI